MKKTPDQLLAEAASIRENCARMLVHADQLELDAKRIAEEQRERAEAKAAANAELARMFFDWSRKVRVCH